MRWNAKSAWASLITFTVGIQVQLHALLALHASLLLWSRSGLGPQG